MGLAQKRISQEFQTSVFPGWKKGFDAACGFEMPIEVKWDTMMSDSYSDKNDYFKWYNAVYFEPLLKVFTLLCSDEMGKTAVREKIKNIVIDGTEGNSANHSKFDAGTFYVKHQFNSNIDADRAKEWQKMLENVL